MNIENYLKWSKNIPEELKELPNWVGWLRQNDKKIPINPHTGRSAKSNMSSTWGSYTAAILAVRKYQLNGIGFQITPPYFGIDLDDVVNNGDTDAGIAVEFMRQLQSYAEYSQSGSGIHIICKGTLPAGACRRGKVEIYSRGRYFVMTGDVIEPYRSIVYSSETVKPLVRKYLGDQDRPRIALQRGNFSQILLNDADIVNKALKARNGHSFKLLFDGQWEKLRVPGPGWTHSEADQSLCRMIAFYTSDAATVNRIFRSSGLYRPKWDERRSGMTYGEKTIEYAMAGYSTPAYQGVC